jgi:uncharacterized protein
MTAATVLVFIPNVVPKGSSGITTDEDSIEQEVFRMAVFLISYIHPDHEGWLKYLGPHFDWLHAQVEAGSLLASGPPDHGAVRAGFLIAKAEDEQAVRDWVAGDPFVIHGLAEEMSVTAWDPIFGAFSDESSLAGLAYEDLRRKFLAQFLGAGGSAEKEEGDA